VLRQDQKTTYRIIGVADDAKYADMRETSPRTIYLKSGGVRFANLVVRGPVDRASIISDVRTLLKRSGEDIRLGNTVSLTEQIDQTLVTERLVALLASFFAVLAAILVAIGLYGVVGYAAVRRTSEIGVRLALGATRPQVLWLVLRDALLLSIAGATAGIPAAIFLGRLAGSMLYEVKPGDPVLLGFTVLLILVITFIAGLIPAIRASRLDPIRALRYE
jgi:putative ABC transport system permease protein